VSPLLEGIEAEQSQSKTGLLPPAVAAIFAFLLPLIIRQISKFQGSVSRSLGAELLSDADASLPTRPRPPSSTASSHLVYSTSPFALS
jgi:hypothetical protein